MKVELNEHQVEFIKASYNHIYYYRSCLETERKPEIRLLYYKELFSILSELFGLCRVKPNYLSNKMLKLMMENRTITNHLEKQHIVFPEDENIKDLNDIIIRSIFRVTSFIRNILLHFPIFKTWKEINLTAEYIKNISGAKDIYKFLMTPDEFDRFNIPTTDGQVATIYFPHVSEDEVFYLKDIIDEEQGLPILIGAVFHYFQVTLTIRTDFFEKKDNV